ncbi:MerR family transcriptional regulator [Lentibacillus populi]|uniref:MerR family transcriptional regulator n=1 Tax=Lentibacillus populi TaxID=1827502 RepID=UPI00166DD6EE|nr:MerR family transcriptional regulator [Lentibacillus populi]
MRKTVKALELLNLHGLCHIVDVPQSTAENWIEEFNVYIPKAEKQDVIYYHPEAIDVLKFIKQCKNQNYKKASIKKMLGDRSFMVTKKSSIEDVQSALDQGNYKDNILTVMQTIGKTVANVASQEKSITAVKEQQDKQKKRIKMIEKQTEKINDLKQEINELKQERTTSDYKIKKEAFAKLFK